MSPGLKKLIDLYDHVQSIREEMAITPVTAIGLPDDITKKAVNGQVLDVLSLHSMRPSDLQQLGFTQTDCLTIRDHLQSFGVGLGGRDLSVFMGEVRDVGGVEMVCIWPSPGGKMTVTPLYGGDLSATFETDGSRESYDLLAWLAFPLLRRFELTTKPGRPLPKHPHDVKAGRYYWAFRPSIETEGYDAEGRAPLPKPWRGILLVDDRGVARLHRPNLDGRPDMDSNASALIGDLSRLPPHWLFTHEVDCRAAYNTAVVEQASATMAEAAEQLKSLVRT